MKGTPHMTNERPTAFVFTKLVVNDVDGMAEIRA